MRLTDNQWESLYDCDIFEYWQPYKLGKNIYYNYHYCFVEFLHKFRKIKYKNYEHNEVNYYLICG